MASAGGRSSKNVDKNTYANAILSNLPRSERDVLAPKLQHVTMDLAAVLHEPGEAIESVYFVETGLVSLVAVLKSGQQVVVGIVGSEGLVGGSISLGARRTTRLAIVQASPMSAYRMTSESFRLALPQMPVLQSRVFRFLRGKSFMVSQTAACNSLHEAEERLAKWLLMCQDRVGSQTLPLTQEFLAQMLGVRRTTVTLVAGALNKAGIIEYKRGKIVILNRPELEAAACECYAVLRDEYWAMLDGDSSKF